MSIRDAKCAALLAIFLGWMSLPALAQEAGAAPAAQAKVDVSLVSGDYAVPGEWYLPPDISKHGGGIDRLIKFLHYFMGVLFVAWGIFFVYCLVKYRQRRGQSASQDMIKAKPAKYSEIVVAVIEGVLLLAFSVPIWASVKNDLPTEADNPVRIRVLAEQFQWNFHYPGPDGKFGRSGPQFVNTATNILGLDKSDPHAADDVAASELHFPVNRKVICEITSKDVIHSFFLPVMRIKQDAVPGMRIPVWFEATATGRYEVACAQLCGNNHYSMRAFMVIHENEADFKAWLESMKPKEFDEDEL